MGNSYLKYKGKGVWIGDSLIEVIVYFLIDEISKIVERSCLSENEIKLLRKYLDNLSYYLKGFSIGGIDLDLDEVSKNEHVFKIFKIGFGNVRARITEFGVTIDVATLNTIEELKPGEKILWESPLETKLLIQLMDEIEQMLKGESLIDSDPGE